ncbi:MFS transporter [Pasteurellaceae bacterium USgator11]|nr:MFS transporter [Pasteurellaceae bacterium USgator41]TNG96282.1 MFS transporter [Pasteurellaceae bacterium UScroc12]TNG99192.1 MFS transporter [Pasteurellaceae bacterium USgator11]TNG99528.1 MFS transporter [Pasteurellaceae bacterium UScroc31]
MFKISRLLTMMFMQYFVQGAWNMTIGAVLATYSMKGIIGSTYSLLGLATIISPLFIGMIADRFFPSQKVISILHILNGAVLLLVPNYILTGNVNAFLALIFVVGLLYYPTTALSNSIAFHHISDQKLFPYIRVFGNIGFIVIGLIMGYYEIFDNIIVFKIAAIASIVCGLYCFTLPHTPPATKGAKLNLRTILCLDALSLFKDRYFSIFMLATFILMITKTAYSAYIPVYLKVMDLNSANMMQIAVITEVVFMVLLVTMLKKYGFKTVITLGIIGWVIRMFIFSHASTSEDYFIYILIGLLLQGVCWDFFFTAGDVYVNAKADSSIKAQAQGLRFIVSNGFGVFMASSLIGAINNHVVTESSMPEAGSQWAEFWIYPALIALAVSIIFWIFFKDTDVFVAENK